MIDLDAVRVRRPAGKRLGAVASFVHGRDKCRSRVLRCIVVIAGLVLVGYQSEEVVADSDRRVRDPLGFSFMVPKYWYPAPAEQVMELNEKMRAAQLPNQIRFAYGYVPMPSVPIMVFTEKHLKNMESPPAWRPPCIWVMKEEFPSLPSGTFDDLVEQIVSMDPVELLTTIAAMDDQFRAEHPDLDVATVEYARDVTTHVNRNRQIVRSVGTVRIDGVVTHAECWGFVAGGQPVSIRMMVPALLEGEVAEGAVEMYESLIVDPEESTSRLAMIGIAVVLAIGTVGVLIGRIRHWRAS